MAWQIRALFLRDLALFDGLIDRGMLGWQRLGDILFGKSGVRNKAKKAGVL